MKIIVKSTPEYWRKERIGVKPNTVRLLGDLGDEITVVNTETGETFTRMIKDISIWKSVMIISWENKSDVEIKL
jgi:hypothetical protein